MILLRLGADENVHGQIIRGLQRRAPALNLVRVQDATIAGASDDVVLEWAAAEGRLLITRDVATLVGAAYDRVRSGRRMPGVFVLRGEISIGRAIDDLELLATCSLEGEWDSQVIFLPL